MKIVIVGDTHGDISSLEKVYLKEQDADVFLHAGDSEAPISDIAPFVGVLGNCDSFFPFYPVSRKISTPFGYLWIEHHPISSPSRIEQLEKEGVKIFVHGHTHRKEASKIGDILVFSPGSLLYPRDCDFGSYLVLKVEKDHVEHCFKTL